MKCPNCKFVCSDKRDFCPNCQFDLRPHKAAVGVNTAQDLAPQSPPQKSDAPLATVKPTTPPQKQVSSSWLSRLIKSDTATPTTAPVVSASQKPQPTKVQPAPQSPPAHPATPVEKLRPDDDLDDILKSLEDSLKSFDEPAPEAAVKNEPQKKQPTPKTNTSWDSLESEQFDFEEEQNITLNPIEEIAPLAFDDFELEAPSLPTKDLPKSEETKLQPETITPPTVAPEPKLEPEQPPLAQEPTPTPTIESTPISPSVAEDKTEPAVQEQSAPVESLPEETGEEVTENDIEAFLASFKDEEEGVPELSTEEVASSTLEEPQLAAKPATISQLESINKHLFETSAKPSIMEFDDDEDLLAQQLDEILDDLVEDVQAVKRPVEKRALTSNLIVDDDLEISFEVELDDDTPSSSPAPSSEPPKSQTSKQPLSPKSAAELRTLGGLLSQFDELEEVTEQVQITKAATTAPPPEQDPLVLLLKQGLKGEKDQTLQQRLSEILAASGDSEVVRELCQMVKDAYGLEESLKAKEQAPIVNEDPLKSLQDELDKEISLLLAEGTSFAPAAENNSSEALMDETPEDPLANKAPSELEALQKELTQELAAFTAEGGSLGTLTEQPQKKNTKLDSSERTLWEECENELTEIQKSLQSFELSNFEFLDIATSPEIELLFDCIDNEIANPAHIQKQKPDLVKTTSVDTSTLSSALEVFQREKKLVTKRKENLRARVNNLRTKAEASKRAALIPAPIWRKSMTRIFDTIAYGLIALCLTFISELMRPSAVSIIDSYVPEAFLPFALSWLKTFFIISIAGQTYFLCCESRPLSGKILNISVVNEGPGSISLFQGFCYSVFWWTTVIFTAGIGFLFGFGKLRQTLHDRLAHLRFCLN